MNHLKREKSPYLLQHAENPVDWYPWCAEAFEEAAARNVPVFLSVGYSTCHWCHVMAHESFEDNEVAALLNENFVSIKVDREERPDIDSVYMRVCQSLTGSGGWPLTVFLTPDKKPFFAGTYFPKHSRPGSTGLIELLTRVTDIWTHDRAALTAQSREITDFLANQQLDFPAESEKNSSALIEEGLSYFVRSFDRKNGGFGSAPKFPSPHNLLFLMAQKGKKGDKYTAMAEKTLVQMYRGGIFDHIGGGFCRYSTDEMWLVPHFEKMLYDNALLLLAYSQAFHETGRIFYRTAAQRIADYVKEELTGPLGEFYCGQDADSDGVEGKYYVFTPEEIRSILPLETASAFCSRYDITAQGNFEGKSIPNLLSAEDYETTPDRELLRILQEYRLERTSLHTDDKVLTAWNGLMIAALARSARQLKNASHLEAALQSAEFIWENLQEDGKLLARWRQNEKAFAGTLEDYVFYIWGLLECYATTFHPMHLQRADLLGKSMLDLFFDWDKGGCYLYAKDSEQLFIRPKETFDGAIPSGNAAAALIMKKLAFYTGESCWEKALDLQSRFMRQKCNESAPGHSFYLWQLTEEQEDRGQLICTMETGEELSAETLCELWDLDMDILLKTSETSDLLEKIAPYTRFYPIPGTGALYYYCKDQVCNKPVESLEELETLL